MAEYLLQQMIKKNGMDIHVSSAGLGALVGQGADEHAIDVMREHGVDGTAHSARQLDDDMVKQNDLILVMEHWQKNEIESLFPYARGRVHLLGKWDDEEISDPYKKPKNAFVDAFEKIDNACGKWCGKLC
jgi:protein-tyrosine phosphatase